MPKMSPTRSGSSEGKQVLLAGIFHETHTFLEGVTDLRECEIRVGKELLSVEGDGSPMGEAIVSARKNGWNIVPAAYVRAMPGPIVADEIVDFFWKQIESAVRSRPPVRFDGVFLILHGAMVSESIDDVEGEILERIRSLPSLRDVPIGGVVDLHANFSERMAVFSDGLVAYRQNPHTDAALTTIRAANLLDHLMRSGEKSRTVRLHLPVMWPPTGTGTSDEPLRSLEALARDIEQTHNSILTVNVMPGFAFSDTMETGVSFTAVTVGDRDQAERELSRLGDLAVRNKAVTGIAELSVDEAMRRIRDHTEGLVVLVEPADNIGAGAPGDCTGLLRALIQYGVDNAAIVINDPIAVQRASHLPRGGVHSIPMGGKGSRLDAGPVNLEVELLSTSDGRFDLEDLHSHLATMFGRTIDMGPCAVVRHKGIRILLTSRKTPPFDLGQLRSQGIEPESLSVIVVKAAVAHRRAYDPIARASYWVDTPGPCSSNLRSLPYRKVKRPIYPLDEC